MIPNSRYCHLCTCLGGHSQGCDAGDRWVTRYGESLMLDTVETVEFRKAWSDRYSGRYDYWESK